MKIALYNLTTTTKSGGIETFNWEMARALAKRGHSVHIYGGKDSFLYDNPSGIPVHTFPYIRRERFPDFGTRFRRFMERLSFGFFANQDLIRGPMITSISLSLMISPLHCSYLHVQRLG